MGKASKGEHINVNDLDIHADKDHVRFRGVCGQRMYITRQEWKQLKNLVNRKFREADKYNNEIKVLISQLVTSPNYLHLPLNLHKKD